MSFQVRVFENGEWIERTVDINHYMSRNREDPKSDEGQGLPKSAKSPTLGFLTRTIYRSPSMRWILPANIRIKPSSKTKDLTADEDLDINPSSDIVFIGDDFVHLKQIDPNTGQLRHLGTKTDFNSRIRAAKVFGEAKCRSAGTEPFIGNQFWIKKEVDEDGDFEERLKSTVAKVPEQLIMLSMESPELMFLAAYESKSGKIKFSTSTIPLPNPKSLLSKPGKHIAVDPRSRAFAVSAAAGLLVIYNTKPLKQMSDDLTSQKRHWNPIVNDKTIPIEGMILRMEFLCPLPKAKNHVILVLVISKDERGWLQCYEWDEHSSFRNFRRHPRQPLMTLDRMPLMLIPFSKSPSFLLVTEHSLKVIENILTESVSTRAIKIPYRKESATRPGSSKFPLLTNWARSARGADTSHECIYLCREDGAVYYLQIADRRMGDVVRSGNLGTRVGIAFASVDMSLGFPEILLSAGDLSNGGLFSVIPRPKNLKEANIELVPGRDTDETLRQQGKPLSRGKALDFHQFETIVNWSPTFDLLVTNLKRNGNDRNRSSIFTTSGQTPHGAIIELRYGYEAKIGGYFLDQPELSSSTGLWTLTDTTSSGTYLLLSMPLRTSLLHISNDLSTVETDFDEQNCGLDFANETIAAQALSSREFAQITRNTIVLLDLKNACKTFQRIHFEEIQSDSTISAALVDKDYGMVVVAFQNSLNSILSLRKFAHNNGETQLQELGQAFNIRREATCITSFSLQGRRYVCIGTAAATLEMYCIDQSSGLLPVLEHKINLSSSVESSTHFLDGSARICESILALNHGPLESSGSLSDVMMVCGLRTGELYCLVLSYKSNRGRAEHSLLVEGNPYSIIIGYTSPNLTLDTSKPGNSAFVTGGLDTYYLTYQRSPRGLVLSSIWFTDSNEPSYEQGIVPVIARFPIGGLSDAVVCSSGSKFLVCQLGERKQPVPRRIPVEGSPNRLLYAPHLNAIVVASLLSTPKAAESTGSLKQKDDKPSFSGLLQFVSLNDSKDIPSEDRILGRYKCSEANERIYALTDWKYNDDAGKEYYFIVLGTGLASKDSSSPEGRVYLLKPWATSQGIRVIPHKCWDIREGPVYAVAFQGQNCMLVTAGKSVLRFRYSPSTKKWDKLRGTQLTSPGARIAVSGPYVHVATSMDSLQSFTFEPCPGPEVHSAAFVELGRICSDGQARSSASVLPITFKVPIDLLSQRNSPPSHNPSNSNASVSEPIEIVLLSDKAGSIAGLHFAPGTRVANAAPLLFEATFNRSITVLRRGTTRPPWQRSILKNTHRSRYNQSKTDTNEWVQDQDQYKPHGVLVDDIVGSATDGTIITGAILDEHAWRLLSFLTRACQAIAQVSNRRIPNDEDKSQSSSRAANNNFRSALNMHPKNASAKPFKHSNRPIDVDIDPDKDIAGLRRKLAYHIDGDILAHVIYREEEGDGEGTEAAVEEDPIQSLIDAINGQIRSSDEDGGLSDDDMKSGDESESESESENKSDDDMAGVQSDSHVGLASYRLKRHCEGGTRHIRKMRWLRFEELVSKALPGALEGDAGVVVGVGMVGVQGSGKEKGESVAAVGNAGHTGEDENGQEGDNYDYGAMDVEQTQSDIEARQQDKRKKESAGDGGENEDVSEEDQEKTQGQRRRMLVGVVVEWLREVLMPLP